MKPLVICFTQNLNYALGWMVIHSLWQAVAIAFVAGFIMIALRKKAATVRYWVSNASLLAVLVSAMVTFTLYYDFGKKPGHIIFVPIEESSLMPIQPNHEPSITQTIGAPLSIEGMKEYFNQHIYLIVTIWAMGVALFILRLLGGISYLYYLRSRMNFPADEYWYETLQNLAQRTGIKKNIDLVESALVRSPMVIGHLKPLILFPIGAINRLSVQEVEGILAHELAHVLRHDYIFNIIQSIIEALFFYHPAVWWLSANIRNERENCCDDVAIEICGNSMTYAKSLVTLQEMTYFSPAYAMGFAGQRKHQLLNRVQRILNQPQNKANVMEKLIATCCLVILMVGLSFGDNNRFNFNNKESASASNDDFEPSQYFLKFKLNGQIDSFPLPQPAQNGDYNYKDNLLTATLKVQDNAVTSLKINGVEMASSDISKFEDLISRMVYRKNDNSPVHTQGGKANSTFQSNSTTISSDNASMANGNNNITLSYTDDNGQYAVNAGKYRLKLNDKPQKNVTYINGNRITMYDEKGVKYELTTDNNGGKFLLISDGASEPKSVSFNNGKIYIGGIESNEKELNKFGWTAARKGLQPIKGFQNIKPTPQSNAISIWSSDNNDESDIEQRIEDLKEYVQDLKSDLNECDCKTENWYKSAKSNLNTIIARAKADKTERNIDRLTMEVDELRDRIRRGADGVNITSDCDNCPNSGSVNTTRSYSPSMSKNTVARDIEKTRQKAQREAEQAQRLAQQYTATSPRYMQKPDARKNNVDVIRRQLFQSLLDAGYISFNKKCVINLSKEHLKVNGKSLDDTRLFAELKSQINSKTGKNGQYTLTFAGVVLAITEDGVELNGTLSASNSNSND